MAVIAALVTAGCAGATPTPQIIYVTPAPVFSPSLPNPDPSSAPSASSPSAEASEFLLSIAPVAVRDACEPTDIEGAIQEVSCRVGSVFLYLGQFADSDAANDHFLGGLLKGGLDYPDDPWCEAGTEVRGAPRSATT